MQEFFIFYEKNSDKSFEYRIFRTLVCELGKYNDHVIEASDGLLE